MLRHLDLFSGIGGFALAAKMAGSISTQQFVEIDPYCQKVLRKNFSGVSIHGDITTFTAIAGEYDIVTAGFPCQDISNANPKGEGLDGKRSGLFFEVTRIVRECRPRYIVLENVPALLASNGGRDMGAVFWELAQLGYGTEWQVLSASSIGANHQRKRLWIVAYADSQRSQRHQRCELPLGRKQSNVFLSKKEEWKTATTVKPINVFSGASRLGDIARVPRTNDGISDRVDRNRALGNAVVPQVALIPLLRVLDHYYTGADNAPRKTMVR